MARFFPLMFLGVCFMIVGGVAIVLVVRDARSSDGPPSPFGFVAVEQCARPDTRQAIFDDLRGGLLSNDLELADTATPIAFEQQEADLREHGRNAVYRITYHKTFGLHGGSVTSETVEYQLRRCVTRKDEESFGQVTVDLYTEESSYVCGSGGELVCMTHEDIRRAFDAQIGASRLFLDGPPLDVEEILGSADHLGTTLADLEMTPTATPMPTVLPYVDGERSYAGQRVTCFGGNDGSWGFERCYSSDGALLFEMTEYDDFRFVREASEFSRDVSEADFELPYPLVTPTRWPFTPISPPSAATDTPTPVVN